MIIFDVVHISNKTQHRTHKNDQKNRAKQPTGYSMFPYIIIDILSMLWSWLICPIRHKIWKPLKMYMFVYVYECDILPTGFAQIINISILHIIYIMIMLLTTIIIIATLQHILCVPVCVSCIIYDYVIVSNVWYINDNKRLCNNFVRTIIMLFANI